MVASSTKNHGRTGRKVSQAAGAAMALVGIETITPQQADDILKKNERNFRTLSEPRAKALAEVMKSGQWEFNGQSIAFDREGFLRDGQTRLRAQVLAQVPITYVVVRGIDSDSNIDTGSRRTAGQLLQFHDAANANAAAAASKAFLALFEKGGPSPGHLSYSAPIPPSEVLGFYKERADDVQDAIRKAEGAPPGLYGALISAVYMAGKRIDPKHTDWWIKALTTGENLKEDDPVLRLRNKFLGGGRKRVHMSRIEQAALLIRSWNMTRAGETATAKGFTWRGSGPHQEEFPVLGAAAPQETGLRENREAVIARGRQPAGAG